MTVKVCIHTSLFFWYRQLCDDAIDRQDDALNRIVPSSSNIAYDWPVYTFIFMKMAPKFSSSHPV